MKNIAEIKTFLQAYSRRDLQNTAHILQYFEGLGIGPDIIRKSIAEVIYGELRQTQLLRSQVRKKPPAVKQVACPHADCGRIMIFCPVLQTYNCRCGFSRLMEMM